MRDFVRSVVLTLVLLVALPAFAAGPRALPEGTLPEDARRGALKTLDGYFPFTPSDSPKTWEKRAEYVRRQILVAEGLWPMPTRTPLNAVVHGKMNMGDYTIEKVYFESYPGHYVTGNLYRPASKDGDKPVKRPGVLCPHGHWSNGRFTDTRSLAPKDISNGSERLVAAFRSPLQARCVQLARLGCVVFHYDMVGYADSVQFTQHRPGLRDHMNKNDVGEWGYFSPAADLRLQTMMGLQTYNSIAALDFISSLPDVDATRLACTGASGGGTQTFLLAAIDPRLTTAFPAVMVSTAMQGGCTCENTHYLRVNTGNIEFAALFAPRPQAMSTADDWTKEMNTKGFPQLQAHYKMLGVPNLVSLHDRLEFPHNYNLPSRQAMYRLFNEHLKLGSKNPAEERDFEYQSAKELTVWGGEHPKPSGDKVGDTYERSLLKWQTLDDAKQLAELAPTDEAGFNRFRYVIGGGWDVLIGRQPRLREVEWELKKKTQREGYLEMAGLLHDKAMKEQVPAIFLYPKEKWNKQVVIWLDGSNGKAGIYGADGGLLPDVKKIVDKGASVCAIDLIYTGEWLKTGENPPARQRLIGYGGGKDAWQKFSGYTYGYNHSLFAQRVHDALTAIALVHTHERTPDAVDLIGVNGAGPIALAARAQAGKLIRRCAVDTGALRFEKLTALDDVNFVPGSVKYGDLPALMALNAPGELWLAGEKNLPELAIKAYVAAGAARAVVAFVGKDEEIQSKAVEWVLR